jgi:hypothetical protein
MIAADVGHDFRNARVTYLFRLSLDQLDQMGGLRFVNQQVGAFGDRDEIGAFDGIAADYDRAALVVNR